MCKYQPIHCVVCTIFMNNYQVYEECNNKGDPRRCRPKMVDVWALQGKCAGDVCENTIEQVDEEDKGKQDGK